MEGVPYCLEFQKVGQVLGFMAVYLVDWFEHPGVHLDTGSFLIICCTIGRTFALVLRL